MGKIIRLTESDLIRLVKRVIKEQLVPTIGGLNRVGLNLSKAGGKSSRLPFPEFDGGSDGTFDIFGDNCLEYKSEKEIIKELFDLCSKRSHNQEWSKIDGWVKRLRKSVSGLGTTSDFIKVLSEIKTLDELCAVVKRYPVIDTYKRGESLFDAISGELTLSWKDIKKTLNRFIDELKISDCKELDPTKFF